MSTFVTELINKLNIDKLIGRDILISEMNIIPPKMNNIIVNMKINIRRIFM